jgi:hypothetical protein
MTIKLKWAYALGAIIVVIAIVGLISVLFQHYHRDTKLEVAGFPDIVYPGFQTWPTPRTFDQPGTIIRKNGVQISHVATVPLRPQLAGKESLASVNTVGHWKGDVIAQFLGIGLGDLNANADDEFEIKVSFTGAERWVIDEPALKAAVSKIALSSGEPGKVYVVSESVSVRQITYNYRVAGSAVGSVGSPKEIIGPQGTGALSRVYE